MGFRDDVQKAVEYGKNEAEKETGGDPGTMVSASVDGRSGFVKSIKRYGERTSEGWVLDDVKVTDDYSLSIDALEGTDIQSHKKKIRLYKAFGEKMEELGINCPVEIDTYSY